VVPVSTMFPPKVSRSTMAAHNLGSVKVLVQPENDSLEAIATEFFSSRSVRTWNRSSAPRRSSSNEQVGLAGARVTDQAQRLPGADPGGAGQGVDGGGVDVRVGVEVEVVEPLLPREAGGFDSTGGAPAGPVVALGEQQLGEEATVGHLLLLRRNEHLLDPGPNRRQPQRAAGLVNGRFGGLLGYPTTAPQ
jgi:hypothetical protein